MYFHNNFHLPTNGSGKIYLSIVSTLESNKDFIPHIYHGLKLLNTSVLGFNILYLKES